MKIYSPFEGGFSEESPMAAWLAQQDNENRLCTVGTARRAVRLRKAKQAQAALSAKAPYQ
jgi:hypothetical protein